MYLELLLQTNRCVRCNPLGTYSLNPNVQCRSCPAGGTCLNGLLVPSEGFFSYNPFVPQILRCPLHGGCLGDSNSNAAQAQELMQLSAVDEARDLTQKSDSSQRRLLRMQLRRLLQAAAAAETGISSSSSEQASSQAPVRLSARNAALFQCLGLLSDKWTGDPTDGVPVLAGVSYGRLLDGWRDLQCSPG
jgi:hypothetical protein